ncbi:MAG: Gfo/Idh/MocA family protein [Planctomycetota bacterium]|jgi:predicted dehydrogenase
MSEKLEVAIIGGGMITGMQILPSLYHLQREGVVGDIAVSALNGAPLKELAEDEKLKTAFPGARFKPYPDFTKEPLDKAFPDLYREVIAKLPPHGMVVVAVPDQFHYPVIKEALAADQHILCVKPLVLEHSQSVEIEREAHARGLVVGVEYHKRFDDRALVARKRCRAGAFGEFKCGQSRLIEPWYYRHSNFQNWFTCENSDPFTYIACHYVDQVHFITGLMPVAVSVKGVRGKFPNGNVGYMWSDGRVTWENGAILDCLNGLGYPDEAPGGNSQGIMMFFEGDDVGAILDHHDQFRGVKHGMVRKLGGKLYHETSPDYMEFIDLGGEGLTPVGYGYRSVAYITRAARRANLAAAGKKDDAALKARQELVERFDEEGIMATPRNSAFNELVMEAGRLSILNDGREARITYGESAGVELVG